MLFAFNNEPKEKKAPVVECAEVMDMVSESISQILADINNTNKDFFKVTILNKWNNESGSQQALDIVFTDKSGHASTYKLRVCSVD